MPKLLECREIKNKMAVYKNKIKEMLVKLCKYFNWKDKNAEMLINSSTSLQTNNYEKSKHFEDKRNEIEIYKYCKQNGGKNKYKQAFLMKDITDYSFKINRWQIISKKYSNWIAIIIIMVDKSANN